MPVIDDLVAYWSLDEASGNAIDAHGSNDLTDNATVGSGTGKVGNARVFVRANSEFFNRADNTDLSTGDITFSIAGWVWLDSKPAGNMAVVQKTTGSDGEYILEWSNTPDKFTLHVYGASGFGSNTDVVWTAASPSTSTWYFLAAGHNATANDIWISLDAGTPDTAAHTAGVLDGTGDFEMSGTTFSNLWSGLLDEIGFWKRDIRSDLSWLYNSGNGRSYADIVAESGGGANPRTDGLIVIRQA